MIMQKPRSTQNQNKPTIQRKVDGTFPYAKHNFRALELVKKSKFKSVDEPQQTNIPKNQFDIDDTSLVESTGNILDQDNTYFTESQIVNIEKAVQNQIVDEQIEENKLNQNKEENLYSNQLQIFRSSLMKQIDELIREYETNNKHTNKVEEHSLEQTRILIAMHSWYLTRFSKERATECTLLICDLYRLFGESKSKTGFVNAFMEVFRKDPGRIEIDARSFSLICKFSNICTADDIHKTVQQICNNNVSSKENHISFTKQRFLNNILHNPLFSNLKNVYENDEIASSVLRWPAKNLAEAFDSDVLDEIKLFQDKL